MTTAQRAQQLVVIAADAPAVVAGTPVSPAYWASALASATLIQGPNHIHAIPDPNPVWNPATSGWSVPPPPSGVGDYRWTVSSLPDPAGFTDGWYWLGDPTSQDGTAGITAGARQWAADASTGGPSWRSFFPYKPSVSAVDAHVPGESGTIHHPRCVHLNSHYIEHMWLDFGAAKLQPFTWILVATPTSDPAPGYWHTLLDAGRNPDDVGFPRLSADAVGTERRIADNLGYRTRLAATSTGRAQMAANTAGQPLDLAIPAGHHPRMFAVVFDGATSTLACFDPFGQKLATGRVATGPSFTHRYTVLGRQQGWISQRRACNLMVFEIRFWHHALVGDDLAGQYAQLSTTYQFDAYRQV